MNTNKKEILKFSALTLCLTVYANSVFATPVREDGLASSGHGLEGYSTELKQIVFPADLRFAGGQLEQANKGRPLLDHKLIREYIRNNEQGHHGERVLAELYTPHFAKERPYHFNMEEKYRGGNCAPTDNSPVPEPTTGLLFGVGAELLAAVCRKNRRKYDEKASPA
ncbi:MAG: PEP-CTERM sorting domain-containing protein [Alphaproteobacteria bacterium]|jgi:hypothetical protein|nr:PEP-CTERM sorting domain-containing protein [Alphaproteobacteria bacterium]